MLGATAQYSDTGILEDILNPILGENTNTYEYYGLDPVADNWYLYSWVYVDKVSSSILG